MLETKQVSVYYGQHRAVENVSLNVSQGEIVVMLGANGAGKSTLLRAISGLTPKMAGSAVFLEKTNITHFAPHEIVEAGIALVPEGRGIYGDLTVNENLLLGAHLKRARQKQSENMDLIFGLFPVLEARRNQVAKTMSGGEQQMVAIGKSLMSNPSILMLDEPSLGLSPLLCKQLFRTLARIKETGVGIFLVEQNAKQSLAIADRGYLLDNGHITLSDTASRLMNDPAVQKAYLGGAGETRDSALQTAIPVAAFSASTPPSSTPSGTVVPAEPGFILSHGDGVRVGADDLIPENISDLVRHAENIQSEHIKAARSENLGSSLSSQPTPKPSDHLARVLAMIEKAAVDAMTPEVFQPGTKADTKRKIAPEDFEDLPEIEIYRKPKIEIYRRLKTDSDKGPGKLVLVKDS
ncbi:Branched-chain amino acid transport ATP-binding protein LivF (TC 3.A.1.4.1) [Olavius sp. associated proteobacterium Delta 1]|nr:Branched-chain amino acid transport ATP-binding protein LivF (TC 3.A.1.4.1) [Olavius sp. associated proteobacterium Delta 1]